MKQVSWLLIGALACVVAWSYMHRVVLGALIAASILLWLAILRWRPSPLAVAGMMLLVLSTPQIAQGLRLRQFGFFVIFLLACAFWCVVRKQLFLAGALFAVSTIKP